MIKKEVLQSEIEKWEEYTVACRRKIHQFAEISGEEVKTSQFIQQEAKKLGLEIEKVAETALIITLDTRKEGKHVLLRADMDALQMEENSTNLTQPKSCVSENPNTCHACGHDAHTAMLLGTMQVLCSLRDKLSGVVYFVFEEGEENGRSVNRIIKALEKHTIDTVWAIHVYAELPSGTISVDAGRRMAGLATLDILVQGKGGHGSRPDLSINPVFAAASILLNLAVAFANQLNMEERVTLGISSIQGGQTHNVIPDTARIQGSLRFFNDQEGKKAFDLVKKVSNHTAAMNNCTIEYGEKMVFYGGPAINDEQCSRRATAVIQETVPQLQVVATAPWYATESFHKYLQRAPGVLAFLGIANPAIGTGAAHHNSHFDVDEDVLLLGVSATVGYTLSSLNILKTQ